VLRDIQHAFPPPRRVLDIGCLAGRFLLHFQQRGYEAVGVDISPGAVWVAQQRGAVNVRQQDVWTSTPADLGGPFDITLLLGHNIGLGGTPHGVRRLLQVASALTELGGVVVINSIDKERVAQDWARTHVQHSVAHGRHPGQTRYRINVGPYAGPWFDWIHVSPEDVAALAAPVGWTMVATYTREHTPGYWAGVLQKVTP
jgi:SAM-dependent methyltransferase